MVAISNFLGFVHVHHFVLSRPFRCVTNHSQPLSIVNLRLSGKITKCPVSFRLEVERLLQTMKDDLAKCALNNFTTEFILVFYVILGF